MISIKVAILSYDIQIILLSHRVISDLTIKILNIGTYMSEQTVLILIRLLLRSSLIRIYTVCHTVYIFWRHYCIVKLNCFILRTTTVVSLGVPIFRVFTVMFVLWLRPLRKMVDVTSEGYDQTALMRSVVVVLLFVHSNQLWSCRNSQLT